MIDEQLISKQKIKLVIQINGKTRSVIDIDKGKKENEIINLVKADVKLKKYLDKTNIFKSIYFKDKIINLLVK